MAVRPQNRELRMVMREVDEDLAIFLGMNNMESDESTGVEPNADILMSLEPQTDTVLVNENLLDLESEKSAYNWLLTLTQPDSSSSPSLKGQVQVQDSTTNQTDILNAEAISFNSKVNNSRNESDSTSGGSSIGNQKPAKPKTAQRRSSTTCGVSKSGSRSSTPTRKSLIKSAPSRGISKPSHDEDKDMPKRAASASASASKTPSSSSNGNIRQKSSSPTKVRAPITTSNNMGSKILRRSRGYDGDDVNPVIMGTKMVHRVVSMRKLAPPKQDECVSHENPRKSAQEKSGFGRSFSKKSLDMALRHMDIGLSIPNKAKGILSSNQINSSGVLESHPTSIHLL